ncbi:MAG: adenine phosphoribosyltransferase [Bacteroidales bacterium]|nr:adenine phosphoribosyltransferase [Bacteroidales bacterium]
MFDFSKIRTIDDFPTSGIKFYDITTLLKDAAEFQRAMDDLMAVAKEVRPDVVVALETRGFFFGPTLALQLGVPFVPIRKKGKLPAATYSAEYALEYGTDKIEIHQDAIGENQRILLFDDVLATGGTMRAAVQLVNNFKPAAIDTLFLLELSALKGRDKLQDVNVHCLVKL